MSGQTLFNVYCYVFVGFLGNSIIGWELGRKGFVRLGLEGPKNRAISFALGSFIIMILWQSIADLESPFTSWKDVWMPLWGAVVMLFAYFSTPRSLRLYNRAKFLHETAYVGEVVASRYDKISLDNTNTERLNKAENLYAEALSVQQRLSKEASSENSLIKHRKNIAITYLQLSLLKLQKSQCDDAAKMAENAISISCHLIDKYGERDEFKEILSDAYFRSAESDKLRNEFSCARKRYRQSLNIDEGLGKWDNVNLTKARLADLERS